ncbi:MAG: tryptophan 7-halogenase [Phycisphaeraceae bacterium]|nr:tryptophan 7-halogenase [Phycisphaeraceae bacterium]MCB9847916.1 tryptophan 7-halogenase [Phycisphaeraceae bacterium]
MTTQQNGSPEGLMHDCDVAIIGGGPTGTTLGSLLKKYNPNLRVVILEKAKFPRDHVGESQLPGVSQVLDEMGCWDKVEAVGFPIKIGASYTWGKDNDRWDFDFYPVEHWKDEARPARYLGQRLKTAFQVDREIYDNILYEHAKAMGVDVRDETGVEQVLHQGDRITGFKLTNGEVLTATHYVDGSGAIGFLKRAMGVSSWEPTELRNIAIWDYWRNAEWAVEIGVGATRVQVRSLPYGWIWFIPLGPDRTSVGLICPADYYKDSGMTVEELYRKALSEQEDISGLMESATSEGKLQSCKDWSHLADRLIGENWFICGEAAGFADPILAAGLNLAHGSARDLAYTILEIEKGVISPEWLRNRFDERNRRNIGQHIRFAQYWYAANGCFDDLKEHCQSIAREAGLSLTPEDAWRWLSQGGFASESPGLPLLGSFDIGSARSVIDLFNKHDREMAMEIDKANVFRLDLEGAVLDVMGVPEGGRIKIVDCYKRDERLLPLHKWYGIVHDALLYSNDLARILTYFKARIQVLPIPIDQRPLALDLAMQTLETLILDGWVKTSLDPSRPRLQRESAGNIIRSAADSDRALAERDGGDHAAHNAAKNAAKNAANGEAARS